MSIIPSRRTQEERSAATRIKILDATIESLLVRGYAATTVTEVQERADVARGTLLHHFPTRVDLMTGAIRQVATQRMEHIIREVQLLPSTMDWLDALADITWRDLNSPIFLAGLELWVAARTDSTLRKALIPVEQEIFSLLHSSLLKIVDPNNVNPQTPTLVEFTINLLTGLTMTTILTSDLGTRAVLLRRWKKALHILNGDIDAELLIDRSQR
ncbi:MAG: TetR/AcrR family transcriptional regulator [Mycobacteriaceae bacterium]